MTKTETLQKPKTPKKRTRAALPIDTEIKRLEKILKEKITPEMLKLNRKLIDNIAFMSLELEKLRREIEENGVTEEYKNGENQFGRKKSAAADVYNTMFKNFLSAQKQLDELAKEPQGAEISDGFDDFLNAK